MGLRGKQGHSHRRAFWWLSRSLGAAQRLAPSSVGPTVGAAGEAPSCPIPGSSPLVPGSSHRNEARLSTLFCSCPSLRLLHGHRRFPLLEAGALPPR